MHRRPCWTLSTKPTAKGKRKRPDPFYRLIDVRSSRSLWVSENTLLETIRNSRLLCGRSDSIEFNANPSVLIFPLCHQKLGWTDSILTICLKVDPDPLAVHLQKWIAIFIV